MSRVQFGVKLFLECHKRIEDMKEEKYYANIITTSSYSSRKWSLYLSSSFFLRSSSMRYPLEELQFLVA
jgi:hypothetical protein